jgi:excisionase family DNA binding protein
MSTPDSNPGHGDRWYSVSEVAAHLGVATDTVYRWIDNKGLPAHRVGRLWKCKLPEVDAWVRAGGPAESSGPDDRESHGKGRK